MHRCNRPELLTAAQCQQLPSQSDSSPECIPRRPSSNFLSELLLFLLLLERMDLLSSFADLRPLPPSAVRAKESEREKINRGSSKASAGSSSVHWHHFLDLSAADKQTGGKSAARLNVLNGNLRGRDGSLIQVSSAVVSLLAPRSSIVTASPVDACRIHIQ